MKYIVLVAGKARRLEPLTNEFPKCLFNLGNGMTILRHLLSQIKAFDKENEIVLVTGFKHEMIEDEIKGLDITTIYNPFYEVSNNIASLWFARNYIDGDVVIISGDFILSNEIASTILCKAPKQTQVLIDSSIKNSGDYNVCLDEKRVVTMGKNLEQYDGEWIGINMIHNKDAFSFKRFLEKMISEGRINQWHADVLSQMIFENDFNLSFVDVKGKKWTDIDTADDLKVAKDIYNAENIA